MLINIFGVWLVASQVIFLEPRNHWPLEERCSVELKDEWGSKLIHAPCDKVAEEINKQLRKANE